ncbi:hypothetical protein K431DRAFT_47061 [Polychaeton citri CBS 116435]|uniref:Uncharacterized protein n=1 Tax=Polychaeton citri CBS 116435 TaxID=1314669 RepID=A0A9P4UR17_9PEZI|nr:hypothetical protein K431DRAFT_47061 [Polychaeton citri CBS 116435]
MFPARCICITVPMPGQCAQWRTTVVVMMVVDCGAVRCGAVRCSTAQCIRRDSPVALVCQPYHWLISPSLPCEASQRSPKNGRRTVALGCRKFHLGDEGIRLPTTLLIEPTTIVSHPSIHPSIHLSAHLSAHKQDWHSVTGRMEEQRAIDDVVCRPL